MVEVLHMNPLQSQSSHKKRKTLLRRKHATVLNAVLTSVISIYMLYCLIVFWHDGVRVIWEKVCMPIVLFPFSYLMIAFPQKCNVPAILLRWFLRLAFIVIPLFSLVLILGGDFEQAVINLTLLDGIVLYVNVHFDELNDIVFPPDKM